MGPEIQLGLMEGRNSFNPNMGPHVENKGESL